MRIILVGFGSVGQSFARIIANQKAELVKNYGFHPRIVAIVDRKGAAINPKGLDLKQMLSLKHEKGTVALSNKFGNPEATALDIIDSIEAEVVIEVTPTNIIDGEPSLSFIKTSFKTGKHVVTTNKGPLALALPALTELANFNKVYLKFSGTVGAGTPILELAKCLLGDKILSIRGILNGTTNYILTEMNEKHITFSNALENAKNLGYAEADSSMDIDGIDTASKLVIMANWIMNKKVTLKNVSIQGIRDIKLKELEEASKENCSLKLVGFINNDLTVKPVKIARSDPLSVKGTLNAVTFISEFAGEETIIGKGAGGKETASAILRDLIDIKQKLVKL
jgi:homoserine dehydrogenase